DGRLAYVPIYGDSGVGQPGSNGQTIEVIDLATQKIVNAIDLGRPTRPHCAKFGPDGLLYVTAELDNAVDIVDPRSQKRIASVATERPEAHMLAITKDGKRAYTSNVGSGTVTVLDLVHRKPVTVIAVPTLPNASRFPQMIAGSSPQIRKSHAWPSLTRSPMR